MRSSWQWAQRISIAALVTLPNPTELIGSVPCPTSLKCELIDHYLCKYWVAMGGAGVWGAHLHRTERAVPKGHDRAVERRRNTNNCVWMKGV